jgi:hypothetical protein
MSFKTTTIKSLIVLTAVSLLYVSCKKSETKPNTITIDKKALSLQLAQSLYQGLANTQGSAKQKVSAVNSRLRVNEVGVTPVACGVPLDSVVNHTSTLGDITETTTGRLNLSFLCDQDHNLTPMGYVLVDSLRILKSSNTMDYLTTIKQNYNVQAFHGTGTSYSYGFVSVNGTQHSQVVITDKTPGGKVTSQFNDFTLNNTIVGAQTAAGYTVGFGNVNFAVHGDYDGAAYAFSGKMLFTESWKALVMFSPTESYWVNFQTGEVTVSDQNYWSSF